MQIFFINYSTVFQNSLKIAPLCDLPPENSVISFLGSIEISPPAGYRSSGRSSASGCPGRIRSPCYRCLTIDVILSAVDLHLCCSAALKWCAAAEQEPAADSSVAVRVAVFVEDLEFRPLLAMRRSFRTNLVIKFLCSVPGFSKIS